MKTAITWFSLVRTLVPVLVCGGLLLHFHNVRESSNGLLDGVMQPTMIGVGALGFCFFVLFVWKLRRFLAPPPATKPTAYGMDAALEEAKSDFDADAAMARYLARRGNGVALRPSASPGDDAARPPPGSFGRKGTLG